MLWRIAASGRSTPLLAVRPTFASRHATRADAREGGQQRSGDGPRHRCRRSGGSDGSVEQRPLAGALSYLVTCHPGLESAVADELRGPAIGAADARAVEPGRVVFSADSQGTAYRAVLWLRAATRVLQLIAAEPLDPRRPAGDTVYEAARALVNWALVLPRGGTMAVTAQVWSCSNVTNSQLVSRRVRDAACDSVRDARGKRPPPPGGGAPDLPLHAALVRDELRLYRDVGGGSLHRRGYREGSAIHKAALNESAAAGLLLLAGWQERCRDEDAVLADPMCGSGTFLVEAALIATAAAPGLLPCGGAPRRRPLQRWHDYDAAAWAEAEREAQAAARPWRGVVLGNDAHKGAVELARAAAAAAGVGAVVQLHHGACTEWQPACTPTFVATNPPWGQRLQGKGARGGRDDGHEPGGKRLPGRRGYGGGGSGGDDGGADGGREGADGEVAGSWQELSSFLKAQCAGADAWVLSGAPGLTSQLDMRSFKKRAVTVGGVKAAWLGYAVRGLGGAAAGGE